MDEEMKAISWMKIAWRRALASTDPSTQNGAVLVVHDVPKPETAAFNGFPTGVLSTEDRWKRPDKYHYVEHAERNCLYSAARNGIPTMWSTLVVVWAACSDCARAIIQCGVSELVTFSDEANPERWDDSIRIAMGMLEEAKVKVTIVPAEPFQGFEPLRRNGELWLP
jgi:dCMP deaminase